MIGRLQGVLIEKQAPDVVIDVQGVGYELQLPMTSFYQLPESGNNVVVYTHFVVREDAQLLFGFMSLDERSLFRTLIKINGVGPKLALAILSGMNVEEFIGCIEHDDLASLTKLPGVGKKTAERLLIEMRDKLKSLKLISVSTNNSFEATSSNEYGVESDAVAALLALGYKNQQASKAVKSVKSADMSSEDLIKLALQVI